MGPRRWGRGRRARRRDRGSDRRFNGAATMGSRKTGSPDRCQRQRQLQWGRDDGVAEDTDRERDCVRHRDASMGPRRWGRGRRRRAWDSASLGGFNGAATMGSRKTNRSAAGLTCPCGFNGAATMGSRKTSLAAEIGRARIGTLQWGRDDGVAEDDTCAGRSRRRRRFNGAATMGSRKTS